MKKPAVLIVEDEPVIAEYALEILEKHGYPVVGIADEAEEAREIIKAQKVDLALLDINIEGSVDGVDLAARLDIPFVFVTSYYDQKTLARAKLTRPAGYIVKPFNESDLIANVEMALHKPRETGGTKAPEKLFVKSGQDIVSVVTSDIVYVEAYDNYFNIYTIHKKHIINHTLKSIEEKLVPFGFVRVHRSYLVNFAHMDSVSEGYIFLKGHRVQIGKSYRKDFLENLPLL